MTCPTFSKRLRSLSLSLYQALSHLAKRSSVVVLFHRAARNAIMCSSSSTRQTPVAQGARRRHAAAATGFRPVGEMGPARRRLEDVAIHGFAEARLVFLGRGDRGTIATAAGKAPIFDPRF